MKSETGIHQAQLTKNNRKNSLNNINQTIQAFKQLTGYSSTFQLYARSCQFDSLFNCEL